MTDSIKHLDRPVRLLAADALGQQVGVYHQSGKQKDDHDRRKEAHQLGRPGCVALRRRSQVEHLQLDRIPDPLGKLVVAVQQVGQQRPEHQPLLPVGGQGLGIWIDVKQLSGLDVIRRDDIVGRDLAGGQRLPGLFLAGVGQQAAARNAGRNRVDQVGVIDIPLDLGRVARPAWPGIARAMRAPVDEAQQGNDKQHEHGDAQGNQQERWAPEGRDQLVAGDAHRLVHGDLARSSSRSLSRRP